MKNILSTIRRWQEANIQFALARVVSTWGSAPRRPGSWMAINSLGDMVGSVSGGCVEGAVREEALRVLNGAPARLIDYGIGNDSAWAVGLSCGGQLQVLVQRFPTSVGDEILSAIECGEAVRWVTKLEDGQETDTLDSVGSRTSEQISLVVDGAHQVITQYIPSPATILIIGGADIAVHLVRLADQMGYKTIIVDPRAVFTGSDRYPVAPTQIFTAWPQEVMPTLQLTVRTYAVLLTHDPKIDDPALGLLFDSDVRYIGALGGRNTQEKRRKRLIEIGHSQKNVDRIFGPVGLKIGAATPAEIALSIMGQIVQVRNSAD